MESPEAIANPAAKRAKRSHRSPPAAPNSSSSSTINEVESSDDDEVQFVKEIPPPPGKDVDSDDEVQIVTARDPLLVSPVKPSIKKDNRKTSTTAGTKEGEDDDDVELVGHTNVMTLPHLRCHCTVHPYRSVVSIDDDDDTANNTSKSENENHCEHCYCYVCDVPVKDCATWTLHCEATDKSHRWKTERERKRLHAQMPKGVILDACIAKGLELKQLLDCFRHFLKKDVVLECQENGIRIEGIDGKKQTIVQMMLQEELFRDYQCKSSTRAGVDTNELWKAVRSAKMSTGPIRVQINKESCLVTISGNDIPTSTISLQDSILQKHEPNCVPKYPTPFQGRIEIPTALFKGIIDMFRKTNKNDVVIKFKTADNNSSKPRVYFSQIDNDEYKPCYYNGQSVQCRDVSVSANMDFSVQLRLPTLRDINRVPSPLAPRMSICLGPDLPALFEFRLVANGWRQSSGSIKYHCCPVEKPAAQTS